MRQSIFAVVLGSGAALILAGACSAKTSVQLSGGAAVQSSSASGSGGAGGKAAQSSSSGFNPVGTGGSGGSAMGCDAGLDEDKDKDGYSINQGDCNDCDPNVNPGAIEVAPEMGQTPSDTDCDGKINPYPYTPCDDKLPIDEADPMYAAKAVGLCKVSKGVKDWGLVSAKWTLPAGEDPPADPMSLTNYHLGHGVLPAFGKIVKPREGAAVLALSSGSARNPTDPGYHDVAGFDKGYTSNHPVGFPKESPACPGVMTGQPHDGAALEVQLRVPTNGHGIKFDFDLFTYEWPDFVCSPFNDFFVALLEPFPPKQMDGNISFDSKGNPISVNNAFLEVCGCQGNPPNPCMAGGKTFNCELGDSDLIGTGFGFDTTMGQDHGSTGWLTSQAPVTPSGQKDSVIKLRFAVYDSTDGILDTSALVDKFRWIAKDGVPVQTVPTPM